MDVNQIMLDSDTYNYDYFQQEDVCRLCWQRNAFIDIFLHENENELSEKKIELIDKIKVCLSLDLTEDVSPKKACENCKDKIEQFYFFKSFCQETDRKLRDCLKKHKQSFVNAKDEIKLETIANIDDFSDVVSFDESQYSQENNCEIVRKIKTKVKANKYKPKRSPTYCNICRFDLGNITNFTHHNSECHGIENGGIYKCFGCDRKFKNRKTRLGHEIHYCKGLKDGYKCSTCSRFLPSRRMYEGHMRDHRVKESVELPEAIFRCKMCFTLFKTRESLIEHKQEHSLKKKKFVCESCGRVFTRQDYLHKHKLTHTGEKQHVCPHCGFRTTQRSSLVVHIRKHTGERPYSCDVCPQRCVSSSNLRAHRRRHLGIKHYECPICNKKFGYKVSLEEHISSTHAPSLSHSCDICGAAYSRARGLKRHVSAKHSETQEKKEDKIEVFETLT